MTASTRVYLTSTAASVSAVAATSRGGLLGASTATAIDEVTAAEKVATQVEDQSGATRTDAGGEGRRTILSGADARAVHAAHAGASLVRASHALARRAEALEQEASAARIAAKRQRERERDFEDVVQRRAK